MTCLEKSDLLVAKMKINISIGSQLYVKTKINIDFSQRIGVKKLINSIKIWV